MWPLVTVAVPCFNQRELLADTLDSILDQRYPNLQIVISDDASTDGTAEIASMYQAKHPACITLQRHSRNLGISKNVLSMYPLIRGDFLCWFAGDDLFLPGKLERQLAAMEADPGAIMSYHDVDVFNGVTGQSLYRFNGSVAGMMPRSGDIVEDLLRYRCFIPGISVMIRRSLAVDVYHRVGVGAVSDWVLFIELARRGRVIYVDDVLARYRRHAGNVTRRIDIQDEEAAYEFIYNQYPVHRRAVHEGLTRLYMLYIIKFMIGGKLRESMKCFSSFVRVIIDNPSILRFLLQSALEESTRRSSLIIKTGKVFR